MSGWSGGSARAEVAQVGGELDLVSVSGQQTMAHEEAVLLLSMVLPARMKTL